MIWSGLWDFVRRNIFSIVLIITLVVAVPWSLVFVLPIVFVLLMLIVLVWRVHRQQQKIYEEARRKAGEHFEQQSQQSWWRRSSKSEGEVTVIQTEPTEQRVSDDVGEYVDFKEVKNEESNK